METERYFLVCLKVRIAPGPDHEVSPKTFVSFSTSRTEHRNDPETGRVRVPRVLHIYRRRAMELLLEGGWGLLSRIRQIIRSYGGRGYVIRGAG